MPHVRPAAWAIVPAKSLLRGKSRLRSVLADDERARFARDLLIHVLDVLGDCGLDGILVATDGDDVAELAAKRGASVRRDQSPSALSTVVDRALADVASRSAHAALVLMADLPKIEPRDVHALLAALSNPGVALVRDHLGKHTNALAVAPPTAMATCFGHETSFDAHCAAAHAASLPVAIVENERIAFDVDVPADHVRLTAWPPARRPAGT